MSRLTVHECTHRHRHALTIARLKTACVLPLSVFKFPFECTAILIMHFLCTLVCQQCFLENAQVTIWVAEILYHAKLSAFSASCFLRTLQWIHRHRHRTSAARYFSSYLSPCPFLFHTPTHTPASVVFCSFGTLYFKSIRSIRFACIVVINSTHT